MIILEKEPHNINKIRFAMVLRNDKLNNKPFSTTFGSHR